MTFFKRINTITKPFIKNSVFRYSHHRYPEPYYLSQGERNIRQQKIIINLLGDFEYVDTASWEIYTFAQEKHLPSANIVYHDKMLKDLLFNNYLFKKPSYKPHFFNSGLLDYLTRNIFYGVQVNFSTLFQMDVY